MKAELLKIEGPLLLRPKLMSDSRGFFYESWNQKIFNELLLKNNQNPVQFVQDNHSKSIQGVLRGLHYQLEPNPQGKLVRCISGTIFDVAVDITLIHRCAIICDDNILSVFIRYHSVLIYSKVHIVMQFMQDVFINILLFIERY